MLYQPDSLPNGSQLALGDAGERGRWWKRITQGQGESFHRTPSYQVTTRYANTRRANSAAQSLHQQSRTQPPLTHVGGEGGLGVREGSQQALQLLLGRTQGRLPQCRPEGDKGLVLTCQRQGLGHLDTAVLRGPDAQLSVEAARGGEGEGKGRNGQ